MRKSTVFIHWIAFAAVVIIFGYAGLRKVILENTMVQAMDEMGFNVPWTLAIGIAEVLGVLFMLYGIKNARWKSIGALLLLPFAIGAFTTHMAHNEYHHYQQSLWMCILIPIVLATTKGFRIILAQNQ
ncbi:hypothetical protein PIECOFPK_01801 [Mycovorax composti]|jgi:hypothetical protein|uniref:DoxX family protein n=2 Tax=Chitinophagaceae TaxID=563835 RepID=A0ABZ2EKK6_9BACT